MSLLDMVSSAVQSVAKGGTGASEGLPDAKAAPASGLESILGSLTGGAGLGSLAALASSLPIGDLLKQFNTADGQETIHALADKLGFTGDKSNTDHMHSWIEDAVASLKGGKPSGD